MKRPRPGWLVALFASGLSASAWLPWLTTAADGGGRASAIGGAVGGIALPPRFGAGQLIVLLSSVLVVAGAMAARGLSPRLAAAFAVATSIAIAVLVWWYARANMVPPVGAGHGFYLGAGCAAAALACSIWALALALRDG